MAGWLRGELEPFARDVLSPATLERQGYFSPGAGARLMDEHLSGRVNLGRQIWGLLVFTLWFDQHARMPAGSAPLP